MKTKDIIALPVQELADDNCHLYLWVTNNFLEDGLKVMKEWGFCCVPETKILKGDLTWVNAIDLKTGDKLLAFDENCNSNGRRYYQWSFVEDTGIITLPCYKIIFQNGEELVCSDEHEWLCRYRQPNGRICATRWCKTKDLLYNYRGLTKSQTEIIKLANVHTPIKTFESGFISAAFDSEGSLNKIKPRICFAQKKNPLLKQICEYLDMFGFEYNKHFYERNTCHLDVHGGMMGIIDFLQKFRPPRLLSVWENLSFKNNSLYNMTGNVVKSVEYVGEKEVVALQTSTRTYIANGYASHNTYKTKITWVKGELLDDEGKTFKFENAGLGQYFRGLDEICLFGVKGTLPYKTLDGKRQQGKTVIVAPRGRHSEKPKVMYEVIEKVSHPPYIELFARNKRDGWSAWGNEVECDITL